MSQPPYPGPPYPDEPDREWYRGQSVAATPWYGQEPSYGEQPPYGQEAAYGQDSPHEQEPPYGQQPSYGEWPSQGGGWPQAYRQPPPYDQPPPSEQQPAYGPWPPYEEQTSLVGQEPSYEQQPAYGDLLSYGQQARAYEEQAAHGSPVYGDQVGYVREPSPGEPPDYGNQPSYGDQQSYGGQPAHAEHPAYEQPGYGDQPPYQPPPGFSAGPPPRRKSRALPIVLISLGIALVLSIGAGTAILIAGRNKANKILDSAREAASAAASAPAPPPGGTPTSAPTRSTITVTEPKTLGGRPKLTDQQFSALADQLESTLTDVPNATSTVGALYGTPAKRDIVVMAAAAAPIEDPQRELDSRLLGAGIGGLKLSGVTSAEAGSLGGAAKCGKADEKDIDMAICGWADDGSVGWVMFFFSSVKSAKAEFPKLRAQIERKPS